MTLFPNPSQPFRLDVTMMRCFQVFPPLSYFPLFNGMLKSFGLHHAQLCVDGTWHHTNTQWPINGNITVDAQVTDAVGRLFAGLNWNATSDITTKETTAWIQDHRQKCCSLRGMQERNQADVAFRNAVCTT